VECGGDLFAERDVVDVVAEAVDGRVAAEAVVRPVPDIELLPFNNLGFEFGVTWVHGGPELFEVCALNALDLPVEMACAWPDRAEADTPFTEFVLNLVCGELMATVGLDALDGDREFFENLLQEPQGRFRGLAGEDVDDLVARTAVDGRVLITAGRDLADFHLDAVARTGRA